MARVSWTSVAEEDLDDILFYIALVDRNPATGERIYFEIRDRVNHQAESQLPGHVHPEAPAGWHYFRYKRWLVFYRPLTDGIEVMRIVDAFATCHDNGAKSKTARVDAQQGQDCPRGELSEHGRLRHLGQFIGLKGSAAKSPTAAHRRFSQLQSAGESARRSDGMTTVQPCCRA
ncbi:MAG: type II toxin-antitoxin system RelE/ParE family toxin [Planctomycetes bacterium]|nr:type II toxin-antitoxin system RelE/ParE family toxin [Planctomycetota bacterium]